MRALLLERVAQEPLHYVRRAIADVVGSVARLAVPQNKWPGARGGRGLLACKAASVLVAPAARPPSAPHPLPPLPPQPPTPHQRNTELLQFLQTCSASSVAEHREVAMLLFASLMETLGDFMAPHVGGILAAVTAALADVSSAVQTAALQAVEPLLPLVATQEQVAAFHGLVAAMLAAAERALAAAAAGAASPGQQAAGNPQELIILVCQALLETAEFPAPLLQPALPAVLEMALVVAGTRSLECDTREQALQLLHWVARFKPKQLAKQKALLRRAVEALCTMCCEPLPPDYDDASELPPQRMAAQALDLLALHLPGTQVFPAVWQFCGWVGWVVGGLIGWVMHCLCQAGR